VRSSFWLERDVLIQSFIRMLHVELGYDPRGFTHYEFAPAAAAPRGVLSSRFWKESRRHPMWKSAAVSSGNRLGYLNEPFNREDKPFPNGDVMVRYDSITADYFRSVENPFALRPDL
jgi:hypothetical protein